MSRRNTRRRAAGWRCRATHDDSGQIAGIEALPFGVLVFVVGVLLIANMWAAIDTKLATDAAAREGARSYVEGWPDAVQSWSKAQAAAFEAAKAQGRPLSPGDVDLAGLDPAYQRCGRATIVVHHRLATVTIPWIGDFGHAFTVTSRHSERIDPYRNGGGGGDGCP
jgi:hypothetical protein